MKPESEAVQVRKTMVAPRERVIGLQAVDGLKISEYLMQTAVRNIEVEITFEEVYSPLQSYYRENPYHVVWIVPKKCIRFQRKPSASKPDIENLKPDIYALKEDIEKIFSQRQSVVY